jgi:hypothetical protein
MLWPESWALSDLRRKTVDRRRPSHGFSSADTRDELQFEWNNYSNMIASGTKIRVQLPDSKVSACNFTMHILSIIRFNR